jgi:hypothetical protein
VCRASWLSSNASDLYLGGAQFESRPEQTTVTVSSSSPVPAGAWIMPRIKPRPLPFTSLPVHRSLSSRRTLYNQLLRASLNKPIPWSQIHLKKPPVAQLQIQIFEICGIGLSGEHIVKALLRKDSIYSWLWV